MKVMMAAGGTAGHLFPAWEVARHLRAHGHDVGFLGVLGKSRGALEKEGFPCHDLAARGLQGKGIWHDVTAAVTLARAGLTAQSILSRDRPDVVAGFGGYAGFPGVLGALLCGIPVLIHEQNVWPGRANRLLARWVRKVAVSFPGSAAHLPAGKVVVTGCPIAAVPDGAASEDEAPVPGCVPGRKTVLVFGGSQGSRCLNSLVPASMPGIDALVPVQVIHISGRGRLDEVNLAYSGMDIPHHLMEYYRPMASLYRVADAVVCRAGAATVTELAAFEKRAVLIPYPYAHGHQEHNARVLTEHGVARMLKEEDATPEVLASQVADLLTGPQEAGAFASIRRELNINQATHALAEEILSTV